MNRLALGVVLLMPMFGGQASAQTPASVAFEVTSVRKVVEPGVIYGIRPVDPAGRFHAIITVRDLIMVAYGSPLALVESQVIDLPAWTRNERFEIIAKAPGASSHESLLTMVRGLLAERFLLRVRRETRQLPVYDLVLERAGQPGPRLRAAANGQCLSDPKEAAADLARACGFKRVTATSISALGMTMDTFASGLANRREVQRHVRNRTGLDGTFDIDVEFTPEPDAPAAAFFTAFREQLGLRFQPATGSLDAYVVERVEPPLPD
jgi:uncharacterized protein (TIGR03435 family)